MIKKNKTFLLLLIFTTFCVSAMKINNIKFFISYKKQLFEIQKNRLINFSPFILFLEEIDDLENPDEHKFYDTKEKAFIIPFDDAIGKTFSTNDIKNFETKNKNISKKPIYQQILLADRLQDKKWRKSCIQQLVKDITDNDFENFLKKKGILYDISTNFPNDIKNYLIKPALFEFDHTRFTIPLEKNEEISYVFPLSDNKIILINKTQKIFQVYDLKTKKFSNKTKKINNLNKVIKVRLPEYSNINKDDTSSIFQGPDYTIYQLVPNKIQFMPYKMMTFNFKKNLFEIEDFPEIIDEVKTISPNGNLILLQEIKKKRYFFYKYILFSLQRKKKITSFKTIHSRFHTYLYELNNKKIIYNDNKSLKTNEKNQSPKTIKTFNSNIEIFRKIDNKYYFIKTKKNEYFIFDVFTNKTILLSNIKGGSFLSLPNNKIVCGENISFIDLSTGNKNVFRKNKNNFYTDLKLLPNGKIIEIGYQSKFSSENKQGIFLWNIEKGATQRIFPKSSFAANPFVLPRGGLVTLTGDPIKNEPWSLNNIKLTIVPTHIFDGLTLEQSITVAALNIRNKNVLAKQASPTLFKKKGGPLVIKQTDFIFTILKTLPFKTIETMEHLGWIIIPEILKKEAKATLSDNIILKKMNKIHSEIDQMLFGTTKISEVSLKKKMKNISELKKQLKTNFTQGDYLEKLFNKKADIFDLIVQFHEVEKELLSNSKKYTIKTLFTTLKMIKNLTKNPLIITRLQKRYDVLKKETK